MRRLILTSALALIALLMAASPAWAGWVWPLHGELITPYRNGDDPYAGGQHRGIDIAGNPGAPVIAAAAGVVRFAGTAGSSGLTVSIRTADGFDTSYLHLSTAGVRRGDLVGAGDPVGAVGTSGVRSAERPHLHFGVREAGERHAYRDPLAFLPALPPATDAPSAAPEPEPAPQPTNPAPAPVKVPAGRRVPAARRVPAGRRVPVARRVPLGRRVPNGRPAPVERHIPARHPVPLARRVPAVRGPAAQRGPAAEPRPAPRGMPATRTHLGEAGDLGLHSSQGPAARGPAAADAPPATAATPGNSAQPAAGPDLGLLLACLGLVAAAAILGLSEDGRAATRRGGRRVSGVLRPLLGRR